MTASELFATHLSLATVCRDHPFLQGIASGHLDRRAFVFYVGQDAAFLDAFVRAYALAVAKAPDRATMLTFKALLDGGIEERLLHDDFAARWGVDLQPAPAPATRAYTDFLLRVAALEPVGHMAAAMAPCLRLYAWLGQQLRPVVADDSPYRQWVETYADPGFEALARTLEDLVDRLDGDRATMADHYRTAMGLELAFFASAFDTVSSPAGG